MEKQNSDRWSNAQSAEKKFWEKNFHIGRPKRENINKFLKKHYDLTLDFFSGKDVLEVGCGPSGIIYRLDEAKTRIGIEPMDMSELIEDWKKKYVKKGTGENLPFKDQSLDVVICLNVLDHTKTPSLIIKEVHRVLRKDGHMLLWVHALRGQYKIFQSFLNKVDPPHPSHFTVTDLNNLIKEKFTISRKKILKGAGTEGFEKTSNPKVFLAN